MGNFDTVGFVTDNLQSVLKAEGIHFARKAYDDVKSIPSSMMPFGEVYYAAEIFPNTHGERPSYSESEFLVRVAFGRRDPASMVREQQRWVHRVRGVVTVNALNSGSLSTSKLVSRVDLKSINFENKNSGSHMSIRIGVRYREL